MKGKSWYKKSMPQIGEVKNDLSQLVTNLKAINGVKKVYAWGQLAENFNQESSRIKEIDIVLKTIFFSEDLMSVNDSDDSPLYMPLDDLEDFIFYYLNGVHFPGDPFSSMEDFFVKKKKIIFRKSIDHFAFFRRPKTEMKPNKVVWRVTPPNMPY